MEDQQPDSGDLTTDAAQTDDATDEKPGRRRWRWGLFRRRSKTPEPAPVSTADDSADTTEETEEPEEAKQAPRRPVGKARRTAKPVAAPEPAGEEEPADERAEEEASTEAPTEEPGEAAEASTEDSTEETAEESTEEPAEGPAEEQVLVPHQPAGKRLKIAAVAAGVLFVTAAAFAGATLQPYLADRALVHTKLDVARTATECHHHVVDVHAGQHGFAAGSVSQLSGWRLRP